MWGCELMNFKRSLQDAHATKLLKASSLASTPARAPLSSLTPTTSRYATVALTTSAAMRGLASLKIELCDHANRQVQKGLALFGGSSCVWFETAKGVVSKFIAANPHVLELKLESTHSAEIPAHVGEDDEWVEEQESADELWEEEDVDTGEAEEIEEVEFSLC